MSLPTPPGTSHRDKENRPPQASSGTRVAWSQQNQYHLVPSSPEPLSTGTVSSKNLPVKSILKKSSQPIFPFQDEDVREPTPVPEDPMKDALYLQSAVSKIIAVASTMRDIIQGYSVLGARIRDHVDDDAFRASQCPLLAPIRDNRDTLANAIIRDLGRALIHPPTMDVAKGEPEIRRAFGLPSPRQSPKKKKSMTEEQVTYARDLGTTCHAVIRCLAVIWTKPAVHTIFTERQLNDMLTALLAIPLESELPTPNARKTCALSIWLIQVQRLPEDVLYPAKDRIAYAIRRGIEGELGKEGKKGSVNDGYKAIHDLSMYLPAVFIPPFTDLLPCIFSGLLGPTVVVRAQACNALGGFVRGCASLQRLPIHTRIATLVGDFLTTPSTALRKSPSPSKLPLESAIVRTLRTTLNAVEPAHAAQGPVWAISVMASMIVLLGPTLGTDPQILRIITALLTLAIRHKKSSIRALVCALWPSLTHAFFQPPLIVERDEDEDGSDGENDQVVETRASGNNREAFWKMIKNMVDMGAGVSTIAAILIAEEDEEARFTRILTVLNQMVHKGGPPSSNAMDVLQRLVNLDQASDDHDPVRLLAPGLFSSLGGLLATEWKSVHSTVRPLFDDLAKVGAVRPLSKDELADGRLFQGLMDIWKVAMMKAEIPGDQDGLPENITAAWEGLLKSKISLMQDDGDHDGLLEFAEYIVQILVDVLKDDEIDFTTCSATSKSSSSSIELPKVLVKSNRSRPALRLLVVRKLWMAFRPMLPSQDLAAAAEQLLACLRQDRPQIIGDEKSGGIDEDAWSQWATLCSQTLAICDVDDLKTFWSHVSDVSLTSWPAGIRSVVWDRFTSEWFIDPMVSRETAMIVLNVPFTSSVPWDMDESELRQWHHCCLSGASDMAYDAGDDYIGVLNEVVDTISKAHWQLMSSMTSPARIADILLQTFGISDATELPCRLFEFVNDTLLASYPPEPRNKVVCTWLIRTFVRSVEECPSDLLITMLESVTDGLALWIADEHVVFSQDEYALDILPLYQTVLVTVGALPASLDILDKLSPIIHSAFLVKNENSSSTAQAFIDFWRSGYDQLPVPEDGWPSYIHDCLVASGANTSGDDGDNGYEADMSLLSAAEKSSVFTLRQEEEGEEPLSFPDSDEEDVVHLLVTESSAESPEGLRNQPLADSTSAPISSPTTPPTKPSAVTTPSASTKDKDSESGPSTPPLAVFRSVRSTEGSRLLSDSPGSSINTRAEPETPSRCVAAQSFYATTPSRRSARESASPIESATGSSSKTPGKRRRSSDADVLGEKQPDSESAVKSRRTTRGRLSISPSKYPVFAKAREEKRMMSIVTTPSSKKSVRRKPKGSSCKAAPVTGGDDDPFSFHGGRGLASSSTDVSPSVVLATPTRRSPRTARVMMDSVEIPTFRFDKNEWIDLSPASSGCKRKRTLSRTESLPPSGLDHNIGSRERLAQGKRQRSIVEIGNSSPRKTRRSNQSVMVDGFAVPDSDEIPSSTGQIGQVTPHHVISPTLQRRGSFALDEDMPSDGESELGSSPLRALAARKQARSAFHGSTLEKFIRS